MIRVGVAVRGPVRLMSAGQSKPLLFPSEKRPSILAPKLTGYKLYPSKADPKRRSSQ